MPTPVCPARPCQKAAAAAACAAVYLFAVAVGGGDLVRLPLFLLCAAVWLLLPGLTLAQWLAPRGAAAGPRLLWAVVYGCAQLALVHCAAAGLHAAWLLWVLPPLLALPALRQLWQGRHGAGAPRADPDAVLLWAVLLVLYTVFTAARSPHPAAAGQAALSQDMLWNIGNAAALQQGFPPQDLRFSGQVLTYHYLTDILAAALARVSGADLFDVYAFFSGPLFLAAEVLALRALCGCLFGDAGPRRFRPLAGLLFGCGCASLWKPLQNGESLFGNTMLRHLVTNVNAQATAVVFFAAFLCAFAALARRRFAPDGRLLLALFTAFALLCVAKGPMAAIVLCSCLVTLLLALVFQKPHVPGTVACLAGVAAIFAVLYGLLFAAGAGSMEFSVFAMRNTYCYRLLNAWTDRLCRLFPFISGYVWLAAIGVFDCFCMLPLQCMLWLSTVPGALRRLPRLAPERTLLHGMAAGGLLAYHLFSHPSSSQVCFALTATLALAFLAVEPLARWWDRGGARRAAVCLLGAAAVFSTACTVLYHGGQAARQLGASVGLTAPLVTDGDLTADDEAAMRWLRQNTAPGTVFATNRIGSTPEVLDSISNGYSALSERQGYLEGWTYARTNMGVPDEVLALKQWVNGQLFGLIPAERGTAALCAEYGIRYLVLAKKWPGRVDPALTPIFENSDVAIYAVAGPVR